MRELEGAKPLVLVAAAALVRGDGRLLLAQRPNGKPMAGLWVFPGGKVETGETPQGAGEGGNISRDRASGQIED